MSARPENRVFKDTVLTFLGDALCLPIGLVIVAFLARRLGPTDYGQLTLLTTALAWFEATIGTLFARASVQAILEGGEARAERESAVLWGLGTIGMLTGAGVAGLGLWEASALVPVAALGAPLVAGLVAHRAVLTARGEFRTRPLLSGTRWGARLALTLVLVGAGFGVAGALWATLAGLALELGAARLWARPRLRPFSGRWSSLWAGAWPVLLSSLAVRLSDRLDFFLMGALRADDATLGAYGAACNLALVFQMAATAVGTSLFNDVHHARHDAGRVAIHVRQALRWGHWMLPPLGIACGAASEITLLLLGPAYESASRPLVFLMGAAVAGVCFHVAASVLAALQRTRALLVLTLPWPVLSGALLPFAIHRGGMDGAASCVLALSGLSAILSVWTLRFQARFAFPWASLLRCVAVAGAAAAASAAWPCRGAWLVAKLAALVLLAAGALALSREFAADPRS